MVQPLWLLLPVVAIVALLVGFVLQKLISERKLGEAGARATRIVGDAERDAEARHRSAELEAKEIVLKARGEFEHEVRRREREIQQIEQRILGKEEQLARKLDDIERRLFEYTSKDRSLTDREKSIAEKEGKLTQAFDEQRRKLEMIAGLTAEEARRQLVAQMEEEAKREAQLIGMRLEEQARETAREKAKEVLHTGVDLIVDDTPEAVLISAYDPYRREIARRALQILISDGRIHPARIEEVVEKVKKEMDQHLKEEGEKACFEVGIHGLHPELIKLVGRMRYRTSYGQNCLQHSKEVAWLAGMMAAEIKADVKLAKRMGMLHDIGKALTHEQEGSHPELSLQVLTKYNESREVINAALCGHENVEAETIEALLVEAADGISAARPGARRDVLESYIKRLAKLEEIALSYRGVEMCYAIQAGRELRVITKADIVSDLDAHQLAKDITKRIEAEMQYPGHIKVVVIRETRAVEVAK